MASPTVLFHFVHEMWSLCCHRKALEPVSWSRCRSSLTDWRPATADTATGPYRHLCPALWPHVDDGNGNLTVATDLWPTVKSFHGFQELAWKFPRKHEYRSAKYNVYIIIMRVRLAIRKNAGKWPTSSQNYVYSTSLNV